MRPSHQWRVLRGDGKFVPPDASYARMKGCSMVTLTAVGKNSLGIALKLLDEAEDIIPTAAVKTGRAAPLGRKEFRPSPNAAVMVVN